VAGACSLEKPTGQDPREVPTVVEGPVDVYPTAEEDEGEAEQPGVRISTDEEGRLRLSTETMEMVADSIVLRGSQPAFTPREQDGPRIQIQERRSVPSQSRPEFTPREVEPRLLNRAEFIRAVEEAYPSMLRDAGIGGRVLLWVRVDENGAVTSVQLQETSGYSQIDEAAESVVRSARFSPALNRGVEVPVWIALPITMGTDGTAARRSRPAQIPPAPAGRPTERLAPAAGPLAAQPAFTPREVEPALRNRREFAQQMERAYPALLKAAGIGGRVLLWVFIDETGRVGNAQIQESSGYPQLDGAAEAVVRRAEFSPAMNRGQVVPVWIALPVTFQTN
jgi:TonB family protein